MADRDIMTIADLNKAIKDAKEVVVQVKFGVADKWLKISKREIAYLMESYTEGRTPEHYEMYTGTFGSIKGDTLYLG